MLEAPKKASALALAIAQTAVNTKNRNDFKVGAGEALFIGVSPMKSGDVILKFKVTKQANEKGNAVGEAVGAYIGLGNSDGKKRAMNYAAFLKFTLAIFGVDQVPKPEDITDVEAMKPYTEYIKDLAETIDGMQDNTQLIGRGMLVNFNTVAQDKINAKTGTPYLQTYFSHAPEGNDEDSINKRRGELDAAKELP